MRKNKAKIQSLCISVPQFFKILCISTFTFCDKTLQLYLLLIWVNLPRLVCAPYWVSDFQIFPLRCAFMRLSLVVIVIYLHLCLSLYLHSKACKINGTRVVIVVRWGSPRINRVSCFGALWNIFHCWSRSKALMLQKMRNFLGRLKTARVGKGERENLKASLYAVSCGIISSWFSFCVFISDCSCIFFIFTTVRSFLLGINIM